MKFGLRYCNTGRYVDPALGQELVQAGEAAGFESAWTVEHTVVPANYTSTYPYSGDGKMAGGRDDIPLPDPLIWMAYMAAVTSTIKLATGILIVPQHNPVITAKQVATLDQMSGGRVLLGIGVGWMKEEFDAIGAPFEDRGARTDEYVAVMRELWTSERPTFHGRWVNFDETYCRPQPAQGSVPIIVGGDTVPAAKRAGRLGDGYFPARNAPQELIDLARRTAEEHGRDPDALEITTSVPDDLDDIPALAARGVSRLLVPVSPIAGLATVIQSPDDATRWGEVVERYADL
ncbi:MAG: LLM class F420-dependent oxidoreductase [Acidimicrobiales bacterium]